MNEAERLINQEMMRIDREEIRTMAMTLRTMYTELKAQRFTDQQAMDLIKALMRPQQNNGGK